MIKSHDKFVYSPSVSTSRWSPSSRRISMPVFLLSQMLWRFFLPVSYPSKPCNNLLEAYTAMLDKFTTKPFAICREATTDLAQFSLMTLKHVPPAGMLKDTLWALWIVWEGWKQLWDPHSWDSAVVETHCPSSV